jgi:hypothetical protein
MNKPSTGTDTASLDLDPESELTFTCPRCRQAVEHRFYGPCPDCVQQLRSEMLGDSTDVVAPEYEPKMNVTPNAVALKE